MKTLGIVFRVGLLLGCGAGIRALPAAAQTASPREAQPAAPRLRELTGDDARRALELDTTIDAALSAKHWDEAIAKAEELLALRTRVQGPKHFETVNAHWIVEAVRPFRPHVE